MSTETSTWATKKGLAQMLKGGVIMDVITAEQAQDRRGGRRRAPSWRWSASRPTSAPRAAWRA